MAANALTTSYKVIKSNLFIIGVTVTFKELILKGAKEEGRVSTGTMLNKKSWEETFESDTE